MRTVQSNRTSGQRVSTLVFTTVLSALTLAASAATAQDQPPPSGTGTAPSGTATGTAGGSVDASGSSSLPPPRAAASPPASSAPSAKETGKDEGITDHEKVVGKIGVGYLGLTQLPIAGGNVGPGTAGLDIQRATVDAPIIGVRYWLMEKLGIDAGIGFTFFNSSTAVEVNNATTTTDGPAVFGLAFHGGVPLAFAHAKHYKFLVIPELNIGFTRRNETQPNGQQPDVNRSGFRFDIGGRVGAEIQFGFIGIPQLALQATIGLGFRRLVWHNSQDAGNNVPTSRSSSIGENQFGTTVQSDPWALFVNNVSAIYYFP
jgi:hypothetical protein